MDRLRLQAVAKQALALGGVLGALLALALFFSWVGVTLAVTPNPGHPWTEVGDGLFAVTGPTAARTYTFPDANATVLTSASAVTVPQGGTGVTTLSQGDVLYASGANTLSALPKNATATRYLSNTGTTNNPAWAQVDLSNGVTGNLPVTNMNPNNGASASASSYLRGDGLWSGISSGIAVLSADAVNNNAVANTALQISGLCIPLSAAPVHFRATILYTAAAATTGSTWYMSSVNPISIAYDAYTSRYPLTATTETVVYGTVEGTVPSSNASSAATTGNIAIIEGVISYLDFSTSCVTSKSEVASSAITAKAGSTIEWW